MGETWRVVVVFLGRITWKPEDLFDFKPDIRVEEPVVPDVTDVPVPLSSVIAEFCGGVFVLP